jgi:hypothetical protein
MKEPRRRSEGGEWEPIKIPLRNVTYIPQSTRHLFLLTRPRSPTYRKAISHRNWVRKTRNTTEDDNQCKQGRVRDYGGQNQINEKLKASQAFHRTLDVQKLEDVV